MTAPAIELFKAQLNHLLLTIATDRTLHDIAGTPSGDLALPYWFLETFLGHTEVTSAADITEGFEDLAIDAIVISDDESTVHFYQFKNPSKETKGVDCAAIDKLISGIEIILQGKHGKVSNTRLKDKILEIRQKPRTGYRIHFVSTGAGLPGDGKEKLRALCERWATRGTAPLQFDCIDIGDLQERYYNKTLPTLDATVDIKPTKEPYMVQVGSHRSFVFHLDGTAIAKLYAEHGEKILQQNIRTSEGDSETNQAILRSATGKESENFYYFNNGLTLLCDSCTFDQFQGTLSVTRPQIVNGGQTMRVLSKAKQSGTLKSNVFVTVRVLTSDADREFAGNVAVNLNNQTVVKASFLRSNHPEIIQLAGTLATKGYFLERREGEIESLTSLEKRGIEQSIHNPLKTHAIGLQPACQAYIAFFHTNVDVAKKNPKRIFTSAAGGGYFETFINSGITAEKFIFSWELYKCAEELKKTIVKLLREQEHFKPSELQDRIIARAKKIARPVDLDELAAAVPQSAAFVVALAGKRYKNNSGEALLAHKKRIVRELRALLLRLVASKSKTQIGSWPTLLKSQKFFEATVKTLGLRKRSLE